MFKLPCFSKKRIMQNVSYVSIDELQYVIYFQQVSDNNQVVKNKFKIIEYLLEH